MTLFPVARRLRFRRWSSDDFAYAKEIWGDPLVTALIARSALDGAAIQTRLRNEIECADRFGIQYWPMFLVEGGMFAGCAGLHPRDMDKRTFELGFHLRPAFWGKG